MADAYAACDAVVFPSTWEGFGIPLLESAAARRPLAATRYPVAAELADGYGFRWLPVDDPAPLRRAIRAAASPDVDTNEAIARTHFDIADLPARLAALASLALALN